MPRKPRFYLPGVAVHVVQRGHNREPVFFDDVDHQAYLNWLAEAAKRYECAIHAYVLMTNHVHILVTPKAKDSIQRIKGSEPFKAKNKGVKDYRGQSPLKDD